MGFIGSNLARRLLQMEAEVTIIDAMLPLCGANLFNVHDIIGQLDIRQGDITDGQLVSELVKGKDYLFNLAGMTSHMDSMTDPFPDLESNVTAHLTVLDACLKINPGIKVIYAGTRQIYGRPRYLPVDEDHPVIPVDINGINKVAGEGYHQLYHDYHGIPTVIFRMTNTYGPGMRVKDARQTFLGIWFRNMIEGNLFEVYGEGMQKRDFNYIDDVVDVLILAAASDSVNGKIFNLGSPEVVSLLEVAEMLSVLEGKKVYKNVPFPSNRKNIDIGNYYADISAVGRELGWYPGTSLKEGIKKTLEYYRQYRQYYW